MELFYGTSSGDRLVEFDRYPEEIKTYLSSEEEILNKLSVRFETVIEVGCMKGRLLPWSLKHKKRYVGIDIVESYQDSWNQILNNEKIDTQKIEFLIGDAEDLPTAIKKLKTPLTDNTLCVFPFNSFGNMDCAERVIDSLAKIGHKFIIFSYQTTAKANAVRSDYYNRCGLLNIIESENGKSVVFTSSDGLKSHAYHPDYLNQLFLRYGIKVANISFAEIGMAFTNVLD